MKLFKLTCSQMREIYDTWLQEDFPPNERKPFSAMEELYEKGLYLPYAATDESGARLGYAFLWSDPAGGYVLLDYLGVAKERRNGGLGAEILALLQAEFADLEGILIESEAPDGGPEDEIRRRRLGFYERAGCVFLPHDSWLFGTHYRCLLLETSGRHGAEQALSAYRALYHDYFPKRALERFVRVPFDPATDTLPVIDWQALAREV